MRRPELLELLGGLLLDLERPHPVRVAVDGPDAAGKTTLADELAEFLAEARDRELMGGVEKVRERYRKRYIPGQELYFSRCAPREVADVVVNNTDVNDPKVIRFPERARSA